MKLAKLFVPILMLLVTRTAVAADLIFEDTFEQGSIDFGTSYNQSGNAPEISTDVARTGRYSMKSVLNRLESKVSKRTEVTVQNPPITHFGDELWYGFSFYLPSDYVFSKTWEIPAQWHDVPIDWQKLRRKNPPLALSIKRGRYELFNIWDVDRVEPDGGSGSFEIDGGKYWDLGVPKTGEWTDWVFHIIWSYGDDGLLEVWQDGKLVVQRRGPNCFNDLRAPYFKMGMYKGWSDRNFPDVLTERVIYHDDLRIGGANASYADVAPGGPIASPKPPIVLE